MLIYVAGKWSERDKVRAIMDIFESKGHTITCDWTRHIAPERLTKGSGIWHKDYDWAKNGHRTYAEEDLEGVESCDILVAYMPTPEIFYKGAWIEVGIALGLKKRVIIIGKDITTVFLGLNNIDVVPSKEDAISIIDSIQFNIEYEEGDKNKDTDHFVM